MQFAVQFRGRGRPQLQSRPFAILTQDNWDDYGYQTTFGAKLYLPQEEIDLGGIKILHVAQKNGPTPVPEGPFESLSDEYCSVGGDLEYYEKLFRCGPEIYIPYLESLRDVAYSSLIRARFEDLEGYKVSLLRFPGSASTIEGASKLFAPLGPRQSTSQTTEGFTVHFKTKVAADANPFLIDFDFQKHEDLPHRMNAVIGYNGTGKTLLMSNLAIAVSGYGYASKEDAIDKTAGTFVDSAPPFKAVVVISYSAFDTFIIPGQTDVERQRLRDSGDIFGYSYCGLRERDEDAPGAEKYRLRTPQEIEDEFLQALARVRDANRVEAFVAVLRPLFSDASFQRIGLTQVYANVDQGPMRTLFRGLSSGHKIVLKILVDLAAHMDDKKTTLVLIDEPETHLHPPLLAAMLKCVRICLEYFDGYAVIATHSPVVLQETPSRYVHVLRRVGLETQVGRTPIETFGENIGVITQNVFNLDDSATDWHDTLRELAATRSLEEIEALFNHRLGFAARSYVMDLGEDDKE